MATPAHVQLAAHRQAAEKRTRRAAQAQAVASLQKTIRDYRNHSPRDLQTAILVESFIAESRG